jgi:succinate dehydrogenase/fumarate reductase cytochrome b subunit
MNVQNDTRASVKSLHYVSGVILSVFIAFHLLNHLFALDSPERHIKIMEQFRLVYRHPVIETFLLLAVLFQIVTGIRLIYKRDAQTIAEKIQVYPAFIFPSF